MGKKNHVIKKPSETMSLTGPKGVGITRHKMNGEVNDVLFTHRTETELGNGKIITFDKLVGVIRNERFTWVHPDFSA